MTNALKKKYYSGVFQVLLCIALVLAKGNTYSQSYTPVNTTGYNVDVIAEAAPNSLAQTTQAMDLTNHVMYSANFAAGAGFVCGGIINSGVIVSGTYTYQLQPFTASNAIRIPAGSSGVMNLVTASQYSAISLLLFSTEGSSNVNVGFNYTNATTTNMGAYTIQDWFFGAGAVYSGFGRCNRVAAFPSADGCPGDPRFYKLDLQLSCIDQKKNLQSITISNTSWGSSEVYVMAVSGSAFTQTVTPLFNNVSCFNGNNGSATVNVVGSSGPYTYSWSTVPVQTTSTATNLIAGNYTCVVTDSKGCTSSTSLTVTQPSSLTLALTATNSTCGNNNGSIQANAGGGTPTYSFSLNAAPNATSSLFSGLGAGNYTVSVTDSKGCNRTATISLSSSALPTIAVNSGTICANAVVTLSASGATTYSWNPGGITGSTIAVSPTATTVYTVTGTLGTCTSLATSTVVVIPLPVPVAGNTGPYCAGSTIQLNVGAFTTYTWNGPGGFNSNLQNPTIANAQTVQAGTYTVSVTGAGGCVGTSTTNVQVNPLPTPVAANTGPYCLGATIQLNVGAFNTYTWSGPGGFSSNLQNPALPNAQIAQAGIYTVSVTGTGGCVRSATTNVQLSALPVPLAGNTGPYCVGSAIQLNVGAFNTYTWSGPGGFNSNLQNPTIANAQIAQAGIYTVSVTGAGGCAATATTNVQVNPLPVPLAGNTGPYCAGSTVQLNVGAFNTYTWSGPGGFNSNLQNPTIANAQTVQAGAYTVSVTGAAGCVGTSTTNVQVNSLALPMAGSNGPYCVSSTIQLTVNAFSTYTWSGPGGFNSNLQNPTIANAQTVQAGVYTVSVTGTTGCVGSATTNVQIVPTPSPVPTNNGPYCTSSAIQLTVGAFSTYTWSGPGGFASSLQSPVIANAQLVNAGVYTVSVTGAGGCVGSATTNVQVTPSLTPIAGNNGPYCASSSVQLNVNAFSTYTWSGPGGFSSNLQNPMILNAQSFQSGIYTVAVTGAGACVGSATTNVQINPLPPVIVTTTTGCLKSNVLLTSPGGISFIWSGPGGFASNLQNPQLSNLQSTDAGVYTVTVTNSSGCSSVSQIMLNIQPTPTAVASANSPLCENSVLSLAGSGGVLYNWSGPNNFMSSQTTATLLVNSTNYNGNYTLTVINAGGCSASAIIPVIVNPLPNVTIQASTTKNKCVPVCVQYTATTSSSVSSYQWSMVNGGTSSTRTAEACYTASGAYTVNVVASSSAGCSNNATYTLQVDAAPVADFVFSPQKPVIYSDQEVSFTDASSGGPIVQWNWDFKNDGQSISGLQHPTFTYPDAGTYAVVLIVKSKTGCIDTVIKAIVVNEAFAVYVPNAFTPNNDNLNDVFQPKGMGIFNYELSIFDRWGKRVFETSKFEEGWNGKLNGNDEVMSDGVYTWLIRCTDGFSKSHEFKGHVSLIK